MIVEKVIFFTWRVFVEFQAYEQKDKPTSR